MRSTLGLAPRGLSVVPLAGLALLGCLSSEYDSDDDLGMDFSAIAVAGAWRLPADVYAAGQRQSIRYDGAPAWNGGRNCGSGLGAPARALGDHLRRTFPGSVSSYGGFSCRPNTANTSQTSVHGTGRAIDVFIPTTGGQADNTRGDPVANWLVTNAQRLGVQYIIWDRTQWNGSRTGDKVSPYGGPHPHHDHIHVELNTSARPIESCTAHCEAGDVIVSADCGRGDCNVFGARCVSDALSTRCVFGSCPATGTAAICINDRTLGNCSNGAVSTGNCGAFAAWCSTAGRARTEARCVSAFCVSGPAERPVAHTGCWIEGGQMLRCDANGGATPTPCPSGQACSMIGGTARCAPRVCPATGESDRCVDGRYMAHCYGGSILRATDCAATGRVCSTASSGAPRCVVPDAGAPADVVETDDDTDPPIDDPEDADVELPPEDAEDTTDVSDAASDAQAASDASAVSDAGAGSDAEVPPDSGSDEVALTGGCGCRTGAPQPARGAMAGVGLAMLVMRRRSRRRTHARS